MRSESGPRLRLVGGGRPASAPPGTDSALVARARAGERAAFEALYRRHAAVAIHLAIRIQGRATDVEDVVHDAFLKAHRSLDELRDGEAFRSWLGSIVVRIVRTRLRRRRLLVSLGLSTTEPVDLDALASRDASPEARASIAQVYALLQTMPSDDRIAWTLRFVERHRLEEVAELAGCSLATAKRRIARAQRFLAEHFVGPFEAPPARRSMEETG
ncbi:MAG: sigma-70 family RNA polymerase sigma factor [Polyangiaceae bacterium]|nr:sigma-70 family RNA polymerase sigma factor [Polyangiaceae bacterium]